MIPSDAPSKSPVPRPAVRPAFYGWIPLVAGLLVLVCGGPWVGAQPLSIHDAVRTYGALSNTTVTMTGRAELRINGTDDPIPGTVVHLNSPDAWLLLASVAPSEVASGFLGRVRVNGAGAVLDGNVRVVQYGPGTVIIPQEPGFSPMQVFDGRHFTGRSQRLHSYTAYDDALLGPMTSAIGSFILKRGYTATIATEENGGGVSRNYVAQDGDLEVGRLPSSLEGQVRFVRIFPWRWVGKKGIAGNIEANLDVDWLYNWNLDRNSHLNWEYVPIRQTRWWPGLDQDWKVRGASHLLGFNEPDRPDQANMSVAEAISTWPELLRSGLRLGAPAVSDGGRSSWLYPFMQEAADDGLRVDFVPVHYYWCFNPADPAGAANQMYNFLKATYDQVKRPLWITEWNNGANWTGCGDPNSAQQEAAIEAMIDMLDNTPFVERYAPFNWVEDARRLVWDDGWPTAAGRVYQEQKSPLSYRQEMADAGVGSSARYSFDGDTRDGWGNGQDAMRAGAPVFTAGRHGQAIVLNGSTDYLQLSPRLGDSTDWSFTGWVYWNGGGNWQRILDLGDDLQHHMFLTPKSGSGTLRFAMLNGGSEQRLNAPALPVGEWTHVAVTVGGNTGRLFVNGVPVDVNTAMTINPRDIGTQFNYLGRSRFAADPLFGGRFDDFRFVSSALTEAQVATIFNTAPPRFLTTPLQKPAAVVEQPYLASLAADAAGSGTLTFSKMEGPGWLTVAANGTLSGTPASADAGINTSLVRVIDENGSLHTATLLITVPLIDAAIFAGADDAEQSAAGAVSLGSTDLELVNDDDSGAGDQRVGLRFSDLSIPPGALISDATIQFSADESQSEPASLNIQVEAADSAAPFSGAGNDLGSRRLAPLFVAWAPAPWVAGESGAAQRSPNLAGLVQEIVSRPGWVPGNSLAFLISGSGHRTADAADKDGGAPPRLTVHYTAPTLLHTLTASVRTGAADAEQADDGGMSLTSSDLELVRDGASGNQRIGLCFESLSLPAGSIIARADIQFSADEAQSEPTSLTVRAQAADHASLFTGTANDIGARTPTAASVAWMPAPWDYPGERGPLQRTPDLSALVREVVGRPGWASGNNLAFLISGTGHRTAVAADRADGLPATLTVAYWPELPLGSYDRWASAHPGAVSPGSDEDGDGYDALFESGLGLDPSTPDASAFDFGIEGNQFVLTYTRPSALPGVTAQVEWRNDLSRGGWNPLGVTTQILSDDGVHRVLRASLPAGSGLHRFVRLRMTLP